MGSFTFRPGTCDENVFKSIVEHDEYKLPDLTGAVCLDIGGHIGSATYAMLMRGAKKVYAFEPEPENYELFRRNLRDEIEIHGRVEVFPLGVIGSGWGFRTHSGHTSIGGEQNTGGGFLHGRGMEEHVLQEYQTGRKVSVPCVGISEVIGLASGMVDLLKIDAEGAEWEVIKNIVSCHPRRIIGEYHPYGHYGVEYLEEMLVIRDYEVTIQPHAEPPMGLFWATLK